MDTISVLIVDDHPLFRQGLRDVLAAERGFQIVGEAATGTEALRLLHTLAPRVVILDINLPDTNGMQVARQAHLERSDTAIIMLTAYDDEEQMLHAFKAGASAYRPKDVAPEKLIEVIRQVARGHYVVGDQILDEDGLKNWIDARVDSATRPYLEDTHEVFSPLSPREMEILQHVTHGRSNKEIAYELGISHQTVKNHMTAILQKLDVEDRTQAAVYALRHGWVRLQETGKKRGPQHGG